MARSIFGATGVLAVVCTSVACASFGTNVRGGSGDVTVLVQNATAASVCEVELWAHEGHEVLELRAEPIAPGERRALDVAQSAVIHHLRARSCSGAILAQQDVSIEHDVDVVVR
jgi:hypothetical protein